jgi:hypothetical protein
MWKWKSEMEMKLFRYALCTASWLINELIYTCAAALCLSFAYLLLLLIADLLLLLFADCLLQYKPIHVTRFVIGGTIEERILKLQEKKQAVFEGTVGRDVEALGKLTEDDLRFLFG